MNVLRQSTERIVRIGPFVDVGDGFTPEVGITLGAADEAELLKSGGGATVDISAATWAAITGCDGWYNLTLTTSLTDTVGDLTIVVHDDSVCLPVCARFTVVEEAVYDALYAATAGGYLAPTTAGRTLDVTAGGCAGVDWANVEAPTTTLGLTGTTIATTQKVDLETIKTQTITCGASVTVLASVGTAATSTAQTGDVFAQLPYRFEALSIDPGGKLALQNSAITSTVFADDAIAAAKIATGAFTADAFAANALVAGTFAANCLDGKGNWERLLLETTVSSVSSQTAIIPAAGADFENAYVGQTIVITDTSNNNYPSIRRITAYAGDTSKTIALSAAADFTVVAGDGIKIYATTPRIDANITHAAGTAWASGAIVANSIASSAFNGKGDWNVGKTGYALSSTGLDSVATTAPTDVASNFREMLVQVWRRFFEKATRTSNTLSTYADNGTTVMTNQTISDSEGTETQGAASAP